jgi:hypothetical protein
VAQDDAFARHEALHMSLFLCEAVGAQLLEHPAVASRAAWADLAERAHDALWRLYQAIGAEAVPPADGPSAG